MTRSSARLALAMTPYFLLCAERAARTTEGQFILHGILERVATKEAPTPEAPLTMPTMSVAFEIREADASKAHALRVRLAHRESGASLFDHAFTVEASNDPSNKISGLMNFHLLPIKALGCYEVSVDVDGEGVAKNCFYVVKT